MEGIFFPNKVLKSAGMGAFGAAAIGDGIIAGCIPSVDGSTISFSDGYIMIGGRLISMHSDSVEDISGDMGYITVTITPPTGSDTEYSIDLGFSDTEPTDDPDSLNLGGTNPYTGWIAKYERESASSPYTVSAREAGGSGSGGSGGSGSALWTNTIAEGSEYGKGGITVPWGNISKSYNFYLITFIVDNTTNFRNLFGQVNIICKKGEKTLCSASCASPNYSGTSANRLLYERFVTIDINDGFIFSTGGWYYTHTKTGGEASNGKVMVPIAIYGLM